MARTVDERLAALQLMENDALRAEWEKVHGIAPPKRAGRDFLMLSLAYRIQAEAYGGLSREAKRQIRNLRRSKGGKEARPVPRLRPGAHLIREWQGRTHQVIVTENGFRYEGAHYKSLSHIARLITGVRWSGPRFFGLHQKGGIDG